MFLFATISKKRPGTSTSLSTDADKRFPLVKLSESEADQPSQVRKETFLMNLLLRIV
jgi:hypothetical protein